MLISLDETGQVSSVTDLTEENAESKQAILSMTSAHIDETLQEKPSAASRSNESPSDTISAELLNVTQTQADAARQVGDSAVYKYYATAAGYSHLIGFAVAILIFAFCDAFPSECWPRTNQATR
jgi:hypothetical protein